MARKPATDREETRRQILEASFHLFGLKGFDGVSVKDIAKATKLSKGALYWHFQNKEELYYECLKDFRHMLRRYIFRQLELIDSPSERIDLFFDGVTALLQDQEAVDCAAGFFIGMGRTDQEKVSYFRERTYAESEKFLTETLEKGRSDGVFAFDVEAVSLARAMWTLMEGCILQLRRQPADQMSETVEALHTVFCAGISTDPSNRKR